MHFVFICFYPITRAPFGKNASKNQGWMASMSIRWLWFKQRMVYFGWSISWSSIVFCVWGPSMHAFLLLLQPCSRGAQMLNFLLEEKTQRFFLKGSLLGISNCSGNQRSRPCRGCGAGRQGSDSLLSFVRWMDVDFDLIQFVRKVRVRNGERLAARVARGDYYQNKSGCEQRLSPSSQLTNYYLPKSPRWLAYAEYETTLPGFT